MLFRSGVNYGVAYAKYNKATAPETLVVDGKSINLRQGKYFIFYYDPECSHCNAAAKTMGTYSWKPEVTAIAVPFRQQQWADAFLKDNKWQAHSSLEVDKLKAAFPYPATPYGLVIENGVQIGAVPLFEENDEPRATLRKLGAVN